MALANQRTSNPLFGKVFTKNQGISVFGADSMTVNGTINKTLALIGLVFLGAVYAWTDPQISSSKGILIFCGISAFIVAIVVSFLPRYANYLAPIYAVLEGVLLGGVSVVVNTYYPGVAMNAVVLTFLTFFIMLALYRFRVVKVTEKFKSIITAAVLAIASYYFISFILSMFFNFAPFHHGSGMMSIGFSLLVIGIAAFSLLLDFDAIENGVRQGAPKYMEWYASFGLLVTLVWLYMEILRLLMKLNDRD